MSTTTIDVYESLGHRKIYDDAASPITHTSANYLQNPFTFTGREYDAETGCYYYRARYYCPDTGRFLSEDPIGFAGSVNPYGYAANNPTNNFDPFGLKSYQVSRDLNNPLARYIGSHNFIVIIPDDGGEPEFYSYGPLPNGKVGRLPKGHPTSQKDIMAYNSNNKDVRRKLINASDHIVREVAKGIIPIVPYKYLSTNSNAAAKAIADIAEGRTSRPPSSSPIGPIGAGTSDFIPGICE